MSKGLRTAARLLAVALLLSFIPVFSAPDTVLAETTIAEDKAQEKRYREKLKHIEEELKRLESDISEARKDKEGKLKEKDALDKQITLIEEKIETNQILIDNLSGQIAKKEKEIAEKQVQLDNNSEKLKKRIRIMYEEGVTGYLDIIFNAGSLADMLATADMISGLVKTDQRDIEKLQEEKADLVQLKEEYESEKSEKDEIMKGLGDEEKKLQKKIQAADNFIHDLAKDEKKLVGAFARAEEEKDKLREDLEKLLKEIAEKSKYVGGEFLFPLPRKYMKKRYVTCPFGMRVHPILHIKKLHTGTDFGVPRGTEIYAANTGTVITARKSSGYGNYIVIDHGGGTSTLYAHASKLLVKKGDKVKRGDRIALVGSTGMSTGNHLHFEIRIDTKLIDPLTKFDLS